MTLRPDQLTTTDIHAVRGVGVSEQAVDEAVVICALFNIIDRFADAFAFG